MPRGGYRPGSGRKTKNVDATAHIRALAQQAITDEVWLEIFNGLAKGARVGLLQNTALLLRYALGASIPADPDPLDADAADTVPASLANAQPQPAANPGPPRPDRS